MIAPFKLTNAIVCEYIVEGANNKHTLINTFAGDILVKEFPASIAVAFYIEILPTKNFNGELEISLMIGKKTAMNGVSKIELVAGRPAVMAVPMGLIKLPKAEKFRLTLGVKDFRPMKVVEKSVSQAPSVTGPTA